MIEITDAQLRKIEASLSKLEQMRDKTVYNKVRLIRIELQRSKRRNRRKEVKQPNITNNIIDLSLF